MVNQNVGRSFLLAAISLFFLVQAPQLNIGTLSHPAPGLFPVIVASLLMFLAVVMLVRSRLVEAAPLDFRFRNILLIAAALLSFALVTEFVNMLAGIVVMASIASFASPDFSIPRTATIAAALCVMAFAMKKLLGVQLPLY